jgi:hypothetical protein
MHSIQDLMMNERVPDLRVCHTVLFIAILECAPCTYMKAYCRQYALSSQQQTHM